MIENAICLWFLFLYGFYWFFFIYFLFCLFWKNSKPIRSCVLGSTSHRNLRALPSRSALGCASGTTLGQRAQVSMLGRTSDAASNINIVGGLLSAPTFFVDWADDCRISCLLFESIRIFVRLKLNYSISPMNNSFQPYSRPFLHPPLPFLPSLFPLSVLQLPLFALPIFLQLKLFDTHSLHFFYLGCTLSINIGAK